MKKLIISAVLLALSGQAYSDTAWFNGASIVKILNQTNTFGECMVFMDKTIADAGLNCPSKWVALSCDGTFNNRDVAARMHDVAMMAMAMEKKVNVLIDDTKKQSGYCVAKRIDLLN